MRQLVANRRIINQQTMHDKVETQHESEAAAEHLMLK